MSKGVIEIISSLLTSLKSTASSLVTSNAINSNEDLKSSFNNSALPSNQIHIQRYILYDMSL